ncbi:LPD7 domain-containing protein [Escherichia coli]|uniref:LPD7 domain-containing protein n=1 Tax=Escherichia coli TaxID=562 RepID=UPI003F67D0FC|nr:relaxase [Escherichia coli]EES6698796.1 relaxase [Escherichia coli]EES7118953.1 relaxase [Escherichia coli]
MIIRYGGGNHGIAEYLENGRKAEREYTRDELDHRFIIDGDLATTNKIIESIEDKGQERYLHITLSFAENEISEETLKNVTSDFKKMFMNAYHTDEYSFYAEAHLPKIKNIVDNKTGELVERKPHIHIVIPRTNLVTGRSLNPRGDLTNLKTQTQLDSVQEYLNNKYNLISPKDSVRVSDENYANVLSRVKGDLYRERNNEVKKEVFSRVTNENINSTDAFKNLLMQYGDVKVRNEGKTNQYFAVRLKDDKKYTNFKNPLFSSSFIEKRELPLVKPTPAQINNNVSTWLDKTSHEIKHIYSKSSKTREHYKALSEPEKKSFLKNRIDDYDKKYKLNTKNSERTQGRSCGNKFSIESTSRFSRTKTRVGVPRLPQRGLVYGIHGRGKPPESVRILQDNEQRNLANRMENRSHSDSAMRRNADRRFSERGIKNIGISTPLHEALFQKLNNDAERNELTTMAEIRKKIDPERFLSATAREFNIVPGEHAISKAKDGSPRFAVGNRNLNASDFLTKYINLSWSDAKNFLLKTYGEQLTEKNFEPVATTRKLSYEESRERYSSFKKTDISLRSIIRAEKKNMYNELREMRQQIYSLPKENRDVAKGVLVYKKITTLERLDDMYAAGRSFINQYHKDWNEDKNAMKAIDKLKNYLNKENENSISGAEIELSLEKAVQAQKRLQELQQTNTRLKDLVIDKQESKIVYRDQKTESPVFTDKGDFVVAGKNPSKEEIGIMLEYSKEKFGGVLKLTGSEEFKKECALVAAERDMNIILRPEKYQQMLLEHKAELESKAMQQTEQESQQQTQVDNEISKADVHQNQAPAEEAKQEIYLVSHTNVHEQNEGVIFYSKEAAYSYFEEDKKMAIEKYEANPHLGNGFEGALLVSKTIAASELSSYPEKLTAEFDKPYEILADSYKEYTRTPVYVVSFPKDELNQPVKKFESLSEAIEYKNNTAMLHDLDKREVIVKSVTREELGMMGEQLAIKEAEPVPRHELEKAQGRDVNEQDGLILDAIDRYQAKFEAEGLAFNRQETEAELLHHDFTREVAEDRLEQQFVQEKAEQQNQQQSEQER